MQILADSNLDGYGPFLVPGPGCSVVDRKVDDICRHRNARCSKSPPSPGSVFVPLAGAR